MAKLCHSLFDPKNWIRKENGVFMKISLWGCKIHHQFEFRGRRLKYHWSIWRNIWHIICGCLTKILGLARSKFAEVGKDVVVDLKNNSFISGTLHSVNGVIWQFFVLNYQDEICKVKVVTYLVSNTKPIFGMSRFQSLKKLIFNLEMEQKLVGPIATSHNFPGILFIPKEWFRNVLWKKQGSGRAYELKIQWRNRKASCQQ